MSSVLVGMFDSQDAADQAKRQLINAGFSESAIELTGGSTPTTSGKTAASGTPATDESQGPIARFFAELFGDGDSDNEADAYKEAFKRGSYGLTVNIEDDSEMDKAESIMNAAGVVDIDERSQQWRSEGWSGGATVPAGTTGHAASGKSLEAGATQKLQEVAEELKVGKRAVARGGVRIFTRMVETPVSETVRLREEHASVLRTAVDRPATEADFAAFKEGSIEVREMAEEAIVSKSARVTGEVKIGKTVTEREETVRDTVRQTKVDVEQIGGGKTSNTGTTAFADGGTVTTGTDANRDPLTGDPGSHPVGTAVGAGAGGIAGAAAVGSVAGPVGTVVGAAVGAVAGGLAGTGVAETVDPTRTDKKTMERS